MKQSSWILWLGSLIVVVGVFSMPAHAQMSGKKGGGMQRGKGGMAMQKGFTQQVGGMGGMCGKGQGGGSQNPFMQQVGIMNPFMQQGAMQNPFMQQSGAFQNPLMQNNAMQNPLAFNPAQMQTLAQLVQSGNNGWQARQPQNADVDNLQLLQNQGFELKASVQSKRPQRVANE